jgi:hypothetical protein
MKEAFMKPLGAIFLGSLLVASLAAGCGGQRTVTRTVTSRETATVTETETVTAQPPATSEPVDLDASAPSRRLEYGHIRSLKRAGDGFELRFDPAEFLSGEAATTAMFEDTGSSDVPNDNYVVDESDREYTYVVPADAHVEVLADGVEGTPISVRELAQLVRGKDPLGHPLFEPLDTGFWILIDVDTVQTLDQQYVP